MKHKKFRYVTQEAITALSNGFEMLNFAILIAVFIYVFVIAFGWRCL